MDTSRSAILAYGVLGFPLAFAALPLYVHVPRLYAETAGLSLGLVGSVLLLSRLCDALIDPWIGRWSDRQLGRRGRPALIGPALLLLAGGLFLLLRPPSGAGGGWLALALALTFLGFSVASINYHAWGAEVGRSDDERTRVTASREGFSLAGVVVASALPMVLATGSDALGEGLRRMAWVFIPLLAVAAAVTFAAAPRPVPAGDASCAGDRGSLWAPFAALEDRVFARLLLILVAGGIAAAIPATLVLFYVSDVLRLAQWQGAFLAIYFLAGAAALPLWIRVARRHGKVRAWAASMALAIASFAWAFTLGPGDGLAFALICAASGAALGAELAVPPAMLADRLARRRQQGDAAGAGGYFGVWNFVVKLNLALAAGIALPLIDLAGYRVGDPAAGPAEGLLALAAIYALLPAAIKLVALGLLWRWRRHFDPDGKEVAA